MDINIKRQELTSEKLSLKIITSEYYLNTLVSKGLDDTDKCIRTQSKITDLISKSYVALGLMGRSEK